MIALRKGCAQNAGGGCVSMVKPNGFSVQYLLPDDPPVINQALGLALAARMKKCLEIKAPGCR